jgi:hypothetical protein
MFKSIFSKYQIDSILRIWDNAPKNIPYYIGTTLLNLNRASAAQTLTGVSISGNAGTVTNGFYNTSSFNLGTTSIPINRASATQTLTGVNIDGNAITAGTAGTVLNTNLGATAIGIVSFTTAAEWSKPAGYQGFVEAGSSNSLGLPSGAAGYLAYNVISRRNISNGYYATLTDQIGNMWFTYTESSSNWPTWTKVQNSVNTSATYSGSTSATTSTSSGLITFSTVPTSGNSQTYTITNSYFGNATIAQAAIIDFSIKYLSSPTNTGLIIAGYFIDSSGIIYVRVYNIGGTNPASFQLCYNVIG